MTPETVTPRENLSCAICGYFCNNDHHFNNWFDVTKPMREVMPAGEWVPAEVEVPEDGSMVPILDIHGHNRLGCFGWNGDDTRYLEIVGTEMYEGWRIESDGFNHYSWLRSCK